MGDIYDRMTAAKANRDVVAFNTGYHDDWEFKFHSSGRIVRRGDNTDEQPKMSTFKVEGERCFYENEDILVTHSIVHFPNGSVDAVMMVHMKKDGLLWRTETVQHRCRKSDLRRHSGIHRSAGFRNLCDVGSTGDDE